MFLIKTEKKRLKLLGLHSLYSNAAVVKIIHHRKFITKLKITSSLPSYQDYNVALKTDITIADLPI